MNLTKEMKGLYSENYKILLKKIKEYLHKWKDILCPWIGRLTTVKKLILTKVIYRYNSVSIKIPTAVFAEMEKSILKFMWNSKGPPKAKTILRKKNEIGGFTHPYFIYLFIFPISAGLQCSVNPYFKTYYKTTIVKTVWYWHKDRLTDQENRTEDQEINTQ